MSNQYRKKPVVIQAVQFTEAMRDANLFDGKPLPEGMKRGRAEYHPGRRQVYSSYFYIETLEGRMEVSVGDWIITGVKGEHYPCKPDIFAATYEDVAARELDVEAERRDPVAWMCVGSVEPEFTADALLAGYWMRKGRTVTPLYEAAPVSTEQAEDAWIEYRAGPDDIWQKAPRSELLQIVCNGFWVRAPSPNNSPVGGKGEQ